MSVFGISSVVISTSEGGTNMNQAPTQGCPTAQPQRTAPRLAGCEAWALGHAEALTQADGPLPPTISWNPGSNRVDVSAVSL